MAVIIKALARGQLAVTTAVDAYTPSVLGRAAIVKSIRLVNTSASPVTVNAWLKRAVTSQTTTTTRILPKDIVLAPGQMLVDESEVTLEYSLVGTVTTQDFITLQSTAANVLDYVLSGVERDQS